MTKRLLNSVGLTFWCLKNNKLPRTPYMFYDKLVYNWNVSLADYSGIIINVDFVVYPQTLRVNNAV